MNPLPDYSTQARTYATRGASAPRLAVNVISATLVDNFGRLEGTGVYALHDNRIARAEFYADRADALRAVGLEE